jgi:hypothetical protein
MMQATSAVFGRIKLEAIFFRAVHFGGNFPHTTPEPENHYLHFI